MGICAGIKILALALFLVDWWLVRRQRQLEEQAALSVGDLVGSIISLDKCKLYAKKTTFDSCLAVWIFIGNVSIM